MLKFRDVTLRRGGRVLFAGANFAVFPGQKVGLTGANGTGKSSLFALLRGELHADAGEVEVPAKWVFGHVAQETPGVDQPAIEYTLDGDAELRAIERGIRTAEHAGDGVRLATLHGEFEHQGGYTAKSRAAQLLYGLGFSAAQHASAVREFSGGWRMRLNLARALMRRSDMLLLDEPTNHLDLDAVLWLEDYLRAYPGALLLISHDREFLDRVVDAILHIEHEALTPYTGNYSSFEHQRAARRAGQQADFARQQREIAHIRSYIDRFKTHASKARQAQSRMKALERMELIAPAHVDTPFRFAFRDPPKIPNPLLKLEHVSAAYTQEPVFEDANLLLVPGDRVGLLGPNGAGKSTLIRVLAGTQGVAGGERTEAQDVRIGYFAQHQLEQLDALSSPLQHLQRLDPRAAERDLRGFLGGFGFSGDVVFGSVEQFSGGEKARLVLALLVYQRPNVLLLDEPTNHLDLEMRHALTVALQDFGGAMVIVSHDRFLLRSVTDRWLLVADGSVQDYDGDLDEYRAWLAERRARQTDVPDVLDKVDSAQARKDRKRTEAERRQREQPLRSKIKALEGRLESLTQRRAEIDAQLASGDLYLGANKDRLKDLLRDQARVKVEIDEVEEAWLEASESLGKPETTGGPE
ncbi:MAG TPA: ATP-binding cassette domain-containing protein [Gammaproteobacteria bacterium]|nr:ATP-binding cassette domain-containing protein [Gammaproteobacteria bacterium]